MTIPNINRDDPTWRVSASGLASIDTIRSAVERLHESDTPITESNVLDDLVKQGAISLWQSQSIQRNGKYKGFRWKSYVFLRVYPPSANGNRIAEVLDSQTQEFALLRIIPHENSFEVEFIIPLSADSSGAFPVLSAEAQLKRE